MSEADYARYIARSLPEFADEKVRAGSWAASDALERSTQAYAKLLPEGLSTPGHFIFDLVGPGGSILGVLWLFIDAKFSPPRAFIYDVMIEQPHRGHGLGKAAMQLAESEARKRGCNLIELHVFAWNETALALYRKIGYGFVDMVMAKPL